MNVKFLKDRMKQCGLTQVGLAEKAGVSRGTIQNILLGKSKPCYDVGRLLATALELSRTDFLAALYEDHRFPEDDEAPHTTA